MVTKKRKPQIEATRWIGTRGTARWGTVQHGHHLSCAMAKPQDIKLKK